MALSAAMQARLYFMRKKTRVARIKAEEERQAAQEPETP